MNREIIKNLKEIYEVETISALAKALAYNGFCMSEKTLSSWNNRPVQNSTVILINRLIETIHEKDCMVRFLIKLAKQE